jgi:tetratricopeptide (TPR) repeat protein
MPGREDIFQQAMNQGHSAAWDQLWERAALYYRQALEEFPDHPKALTSLGLALYELQNYEESLQNYERAARVSTDDPLPWEKVAQLSERIGDIERAAKAAFQAAELYLKKREVDKAIENWSRVTRLNPESLPAHSRLALVYERLRRKPQAVTEYLAVASLMQAGGEMEKAIQAVNRALMIVPNSVEANQALTLLREVRPLPKPVRSRGGTAPLRMSQVRQLEAVKQADRFTGLDPIAEARQKALGVLAGMLFEQAEETPTAGPTGKRGIQAIVRGMGDAHFAKQADRNKILLHLSQAVDMQTHNQDEQAAEDLQRAIDAGLEHAAAYFDLGLLHSQSTNHERLEKAARHMQIAVKHADYALGGRLLLGQIFRKLEKPEAALEFLEALKLADGRVVSDEQADELRQLYEPLIEAEAKQSDAQAKDKLCDDITALLLRPDWRQHLSEARQNLPAAAEGSPPMPLGEILTAARSGRIIESVATIHRLARSGLLRSAIEEAFYALQFAPTYLPLHIYLGELLLQQGHIPEAITKLSVVAQTYSARGEPDRAIELLRRIINQAPMDIGTRKRLIEQLLARGQVEEAINEYLQMADVYYSLADLSLARQTYTEALRLAQQSNVDRSSKVQILHQMADIDLQSLDWRQAVRVYEQIRTLQPDDQPARVSLISLNFRLGQESQAMAELNNHLSYLGSSDQRDKVVKFLEDLVSEIPDQIALRRYLADVYLKLQRVEDAIAQLDAVGEKLLAKGDETAAAAVIEEILALNPDRKSEYQRLLTQLRKR